ncbi:hypothetical protein [Massilia antarctica]|uniref:hypothetical protein n=1 Tax=Massilia antarctica TaxID=2765360 RepID=UPI0006BB90A5|nr:hypothetical protein [Massilia sp. H27-R4]MCY0910934.1 hypothetical protein [Massilia sp. H27-R4]CUI08781.1 hypothetical protein BN2497_12339 [Janthinobacterium sp. CG23_2]CUU32567.1 hypothetical protein BN3177_12339 [Janthinobacterium sp. CG23_2]
MTTEASTIALSGFDYGGEPEIRIMADGKVVLAFEYMPPSFVEDRDAYGNFDQQIEAAIGVPVLWEDREIFTIEAPAADTVARLTDFIQNYQHDGKWLTPPAATQ